MQFLIDAQLPPALARALVAIGHEATHVADINLATSEDQPIWEEARQRRTVIISKDEDFATLVMLSKNGPSVIWVRIGNCSNRALLEWFIPLVNDIVQRLNHGERLIELV